MTGCLHACNCETETRDPEHSPGPVEDDEILCRGALTPRHGTPTNIKSSFVPRTHLAARKLSVYRASEKARFSVLDVVTEVSNSVGAGQTLAALFGARVGDVRSIRVASRNGRALCVRDECDIDDQEGKHHAHAHIALCDLAFPDPVDLEGEAFKQVHGDLLTLFRGRKLHP